MFWDTYFCLGENPCTPEVILDPGAHSASKSERAYREPDFTPPGVAPPAPFEIVWPGVGVGNDGTLGTDTATDGATNPGPRSAPSVSGLPGVGVTRTGAAGVGAALTGALEGTLALGAGAPLTAGVALGAASFVMASSSRPLR